MKKITKLLFLGIALVLFSCNVDQVDTSQESESVEALSEELDFESVYQDSLKSVEHRWRFNKKKKIASYKVSDIDRCDVNFDASFWWWNGQIENFRDGFFTNSKKWPLTFTEYEDGTAQIFGMAQAVAGQKCKVFVNIWLKNKKNYAEFQEVGGDLKVQGCSNAVAEEQNYYVVNQRRSYMMACGSDCIKQGIYGFEQRPDPTDTNTPNFGFAVGPGGALWDDVEGVPGLAGWGWITNRHTGERLWEADFNFNIERCVRKIQKCAVFDANRCDDTDDPDANFWWWDYKIENFDESFFEKTKSKYTFTEYDNGTAHIKGEAVAVFGRDCKIDIDVWLKDRKTSEEWQELGGGLKENDGCSGADINDLHFYVVDTERSKITAAGGECLGASGTTYKLEQRPDPTDFSTPNFGFAVGPGGALWDTDPNTYGVAGWVWLVNEATDERWEADFNFTTNCR